jgi:hypothetical protein
VIKTKRYQNKFKTYLRQCRDCDDIFHAEKKRDKYCSECKKIRVDRRFANSLKSRGIVVAKFQININTRRKDDRVVSKPNNNNKSNTNNFI